MHLSAQDGVGGRSRRERRSRRNRGRNYPIGLPLHSSAAHMNPGRGETGSSSWQHQRRTPSVWPPPARLLCPLPSVRELLPYSYYCVVFAVRPPPPPFPCGPEGGDPS